MRAEVKQKHGTSQATTCVHLGFPRIAKAGTPVAETSESFPSENIYLSFSALQGKKGGKKKVKIIHGKEKIPTLIFKQ